MIGAQKKNKLKLIIDDARSSSVMKFVGVEKDSNNLITASDDGTLKVWNTTTFECLDTISIRSEGMCLLKTRSGRHLLCGFEDGFIEVRQLSDLSLVSSIDLIGSRARRWPVSSLCELDDGTFVAALIDLKRFHALSVGKEKGCGVGVVLQTFSGHTNRVTTVIELKHDIIVSASLDEKVKMWRVSSSECLRTLTQHDDYVFGLVKLTKEGYFASGSMDRTIRVWNEKGNDIAIYQTECAVVAMTRLEDGSIVVGDRSLIEIRRL